MKAAVYYSYGPPDVLKVKEVETPIPKDNEVLVKVHASSVSAGDWRLRKPDPFITRLFFGLTKPKVNILGSEFSGEIASTGKNVTSFKPGDPVFGSTSTRLRSNAEYLVIPENGAITTKPENIKHEEAAGISFGGDTALHFLKKGNIKEGNKVLIYGASGSLGTYAVQLAKAYGAEVTGVCSTKNIELVKSLGADRVIDYTLEDFTKRGESYDIIFDTVGKSPFNGSIRSLKKGGKYLRAVHMSFGPILKGIWATMTKGNKVIGGVASDTKESVDTLKKFLEEGKIKAVIDRTYPLAEIADAHAYVEQGHKKGNVVITIDVPRK